MLLRPLPRRVIVSVLALVGALALVVAIAELGSGMAGLGGAWFGFGASLVVAVACGWAAFRVGRGPRSRAAITGQLVLFEAPMPGISLGASPALTIRGPRDAVERFIPVSEFESRFGGWALWAEPAQPTSDMPGEALGVWGRRTCSRFRRILRERGAVLEVRREAGPAQRIRQLVARPRGRA